MSNNYVVKTREELFKEIKRILDGCEHINFTDEQIYFMVDCHLIAMKEQGYIED